MFPKVHDGKGSLTMANLVAFLNSFLSYLLLFAICVAVVIVAAMIGMALRRKKNAEEALEAQKEDADTTAAGV